MFCIPQSMAFATSPIWLRSLFACTYIRTPLPSIVLVIVLYYSVTKCPPAGPADTGGRKGDGLCGPDPRLGAGVRSVISPSHQHLAASPRIAFQWQTQYLRDSILWILMTTLFLLTWMFFSAFSFHLKPHLNTLIILFKPVDFHLQPSFSLIVKAEHNYKMFPGTQCTSQIIFSVLSSYLCIVIP